MEETYQKLMQTGALKAQRKREYRGRDDKGGLVSGAARP